MKKTIGVLGVLALCLALVAPSYAWRNGTSWGKTQGWASRQAWRGGPWLSDALLADFEASLTSSLIPERSWENSAPTFTRATTATVWGYDVTDNWEILTVASGEARFHGARRISEGVWSTELSDGTPIADATLRGYLAEGARTNLVTHSHELDNVAWTATGGAITPDDDAGPLGTTTADLFTSSDANPTLYDDVTVSPETVYTASWWAWDLSGGSVYYQFYDNTGAANIEGPTEYTTELNGATPTRVSHSFTTPAGCVSVAVNIIVDLPSGQSIHLEGVQVEAGAFPSTYIPTSGATATRNADLLSYPSAGNILDTQGSVAVAIQRNWLDGQSASTYARIVGLANAGELLALLSSTGALASFDGTGWVTTAAQIDNDLNRHLVGYEWDAGTGEQLGVIDGVMDTPDAFDGAYPTTGIYIGYRGVSNTDQFFGTIRDLRIYKRAFSDAQMEALTQ